MLVSAEERVLVFGYRKHYTVDQYGNPTEGACLCFVFPMNAPLFLIFHCSSLLDL